jgi:hypothetical protein
MPAAHSSRRRAEPRHSTPPGAASGLHRLNDQGSSHLWVSGGHFAALLAGNRPAQRGEWPIYHVPQRSEWAVHHVLYASANKLTSS